MRAHIALTLGFLALAAPALAAPTVWVCDLVVPRAQSWIPAKLVIRHDPGSGSVIVNDPVILTFRGQPVAGRVAVDNTRRTTFAWELSDLRTPGGQTVKRFQYRATIAKPGGTVQVSATPLGFDNTFLAEGRCTRQ